MSDAAAVRLHHPMWPDGREFDPVVAETMRRQGWTDEPGDATEPDEPDLSALADLDADELAALDALTDDELAALTALDAPNPPTTGFGHSTIGGPRG